ncbi:MAG: hypothetical protein IH933_07190 [Euryarchaeota archaeon]|nr:hypothetical protein [Euryarchaeota archaeon]
MSRRRFLAGATVLPVAVTGCLGRGENPNTPTQMAAESRHWTGIVFKDTKQVVERLELEDKPTAYHEIITDLDDLVPHSLTVRVTDGQAVVSDEISIEIDGTKAGVD